jgi:beta-carotene 15,15'-monooxygenase
MASTHAHLGFHSLDSERSVQLSVEGDLPEWLTGTLIRNGPGAFEMAGRSVDHWFDGLAMLHAFEFGDGVAYRNRFLRTDAYRAAREGDFQGGFATGETTLRDRLRSFLFEDPYDNTNIIAERLGEDYLALTETPRWVRFDPETLDTLGDVEYDGDAPGGQLSCAHLKRDPATDELFGFDVAFGRSSQYHVYAMTGPRKRRHVASITVDEPAYMHSFALTPNYVVLTEFPLRVNPMAFFRPGRQGPFIENFEWKPEQGTTFHVVDRDRGALLAQPTTEAFFGFHHVNAYEDGSEIVVDLETVPDTASLDALYLDRLRSGDFDVFAGALDRFRVTLDGTPAVERTRIYEGGTALPTTSPAWWLADHRYVYAQGTDQPVESWPRRLVKIDTETRTVTEFTDDAHHFSEPIFVPRVDPRAETAGDADPDETPEDDGVVLSVALDTDGGHSWLVVLDGESFEERARAKLPHAVPFDFHGRYFPEL